MFDLTGRKALVTGATGGVGSVAIALLKKAGFTVIAATGKAGEEDYLKGLGAAGIVDRAELSAPGKPFQKERWAGVVDTAGSHILANAIAQTKYDGVVAACGLAQGGDLPTSVMPFILRGVTLIGVDSVTKPKPARIAAYELLARDLDAAALDAIVTEIGLGQAIETAAKFVDGTVKGRYVVDVNK